MTNLTNKEMEAVLDTKRELVVEEEATILDTEITYVPEQEVKRQSLAVGHLQKADTMVKEPAHIKVVIKYKDYSDMTCYEHLSFER